MIRRHVVLFVREPRLGRGKRRLARDIGDVAALRFERAMLALLVRRLGRDRRWRMRLAVTPDRARLAKRTWPRGLVVSAQGSGDLGRRMQRALTACPPGPVLLVGADIPALGAAHLMTAFVVCGRCDVVFGPAADGGFWLVGTRRPRPLPQMFCNVRWSGPHALADTLAGLPPRLGVGLAARLEDVDDGGSWRRLKPPRGF